MQQSPYFPIANQAVAQRARIAIITSQYNGALTKNLEQHCVATLQAAGMPRKNIATFAVPGALEIPMVAKHLATSGRFQAIIALGVVLKGETYHFEIVANQCAAGLQLVAVQTDVPVINEVLACYTRKQAETRCGNHADNKGIEAARTALQMIALLDRIITAPNEGPHPPPSSTSGGLRRTSTRSFGERGK